MADTSQPQTDASSGDIVVVSQRAPKHPCALPRRRERKRLGVQIGTVVQCSACKQFWRWDLIGWDFPPEWQRITDGEASRG